MSTCSDSWNKLESNDFKPICILILTFYDEKKIEQLLFEECENIFNFQ